MRDMNLLQDHKPSACPMKIPDETLSPNACIRACRRRDSGDAKYTHRTTVGSICNDRLLAVLRDRLYSLSAVHMPTVTPCRCTKPPQPRVHTGEARPGLSVSGIPGASFNLLVRIDNRYKRQYTCGPVPIPGRPRGSKR